MMELPQAYRLRLKYLNLLKRNDLTKLQVKRISQELEDYKQDNPQWMDDLDNYIHIS